MKTKNALLLLLAAFAILCQSCVDNSYDLSKLPSNVTLMGDSLVLPLGISDSVLIGKFMKDQKIDNFVISNDILYVNQGGSIPLTLPTQDQFTIANPNAISVDQETRPSPLLLDNTPYDISNPLINIAEKETPLLAINSSFGIVQRIDTVSFNTTTDPAKLSMILDIKGTKIQNPYNIILTIPTGIDLLDNTTDSPITLNPNREYTLPMSAMTSFNTTKTIEFKIKKLYNLSNLVFKFKFAFGSSNSITYSGTPNNLSLSVSASNLKITTFKGKINYSGTKSGIDTDISAIYKLFKNPTDVIEISDPTLQINSTSNFGIPLNTTLNVKAYKNSAPNTAMTISGSTSTTLTINPPATLGATANNNFTINNSKISFTNIIKAKPDRIKADIIYNSIGSDVSGEWGSITKPHFITSTSTGTVNYTFKIPFAFGSNFALSFKDTINDVFDSEIKDLFFTKGKITLKGTIVSNLPLGASMSVFILSSKIGEVNIPILNNQQVLASTDYSKKETPFSITITAEQLKTMTSPRNLSFNFSINSSAATAGKPLKASNYIFTKDLVLIKTGGLDLK